MSDFLTQWLDCMLKPIEIDALFSAVECERIVSEAPPDSFINAGLVRGVQADNMRRSRIAWLDDNADAAWVFRRLLASVAAANRQHFGFDLEEFAECMQLAWYGADEVGFFDWHIDLGQSPIAARRKLTMVVQLSHASTYEGGHLETNVDGNVRQASRAIGSGLLMPSFVLHRVAPVRSGERYSLTLWSHGPAFR